MPMKRREMLAAASGFGLALVPGGAQAQAAGAQNAGAQGAKGENDLTADSLPQEGVPQGRITQFRHKSAKIYPGAERDVWVYTPAQYTPDKPACVMVFQDGGGWQSRTGGYRATTVFDNLIHKGEMPVTVGVFVNPGVTSPLDAERQLPRFNRSLEYDSLTDLYVRFLLEEILPEVGKTVKLTSDPGGRAIGGASSGGIAAFTAGWNRPDAFRRVLSFIGSFTDLRGGNIYPSLIRKTEPKPLRIFLQEGANDQDIYRGSWPIGNNDVAAALKFADYDYRYVVGTGGHDGRQGTALLPDALRFLWRDYPKSIEAKPAPRQPLYRDILLPGEDWQTQRRLPFDITSVASNGKGSLFLSTGDSKLHLRFGGGIVLSSPVRSGPITNLVCQADDTVWGINSQREASGFYIGLADPKDAFFGKAAQGPLPSLFALTAEAGGRLFTADFKGAIHHWVGSFAPYQVGALPGGSRALCLSPDQSLLFAASEREPYIYSFRVGADGMLSDAEAFHEVIVPPGATAPQVTAMATDKNGWLYAASPLGIQVLDQAGRVNGVIALPQGQRVVSLTWGGDNNEILYAVAGGRLFARKTKAVGVLPHQEPVKPPSPRL